MTEMQTIPAHVPADAVRDFDLYNYPVHGWDFATSLIAATRGADMPKVIWSPHNGGHWIVTDPDLLVEVVNDHTRFSNRYIGVPKALNPKVIQRPFQMDPPDSEPFRKLIAGGLTQRIVQAGREAVRDLTIRLVEELRPLGRCDFVNDFAQHMPIRMFMAIMDLPEEDRLPLLKTVEKVGRPAYPEQRMEGYDELDVYINHLLDTRGQGDKGDFISQIAQADINGRPITREEASGVLLLLLLAGLDTVAGLLGLVAMHFATHPQDRDKIIAQPDLINGAVEELLRRFPITSLAREVRMDLDFGGVKMKQGDMVSAPLTIFGLDDQHFPDAATVDFERPNRNEHISFGGQTHRCLGALLARIELRIFLEQFLTRMPPFRIAPDAVPATRTRVTSVITHLPLVWDVPS